MAKSKKSKKTNTVALIAAALVVVGLILVIVGMVTNWIGVSDEFLKMSDINEANDVYKKLTDKSLDGYDAMNAFMIITVIVAAITLVGAGVGLVLKIKIIRLVVAVAAVLTVLAAILALVFTYQFCDKFGSGLIEYTPAVGAWLLTIGGVLAGLGGLGCAAKS